MGKAMSQPLGKRWGGGPTNKATSAGCKSEASGRDQGEERDTGVLHLHKTAPGVC